MQEKPGRPLRSRLAGPLAALAIALLLALYGPPSRESLDRMALAQLDPRVEAFIAESPDAPAEMRRIYSPDRSQVGYEVKIGPVTRRFLHPVRSWISILPTLLAIVTALVFRRALLPLVLGVALGALLLENFAVTRALGRSVHYVYGAATTQFNVTLILFILGLIGMTAIGVRGGGVRGMVDALLHSAHSARRIRIVGPLLGLVIFFDDYSNTVVLGNAMRPVTDRLKVPREKLAYIVDSTAAPVAGLMFFSTWIWYEVSQIQEPLLALGAITAPDQAYAVFIQAIPFRFYCIFTLAFVILNGLLARDFGSMLRAERRAAGGGGVIRRDGRPLLGRSLAGLAEKDGVPRRAWNMAAPLLFTIASIATGLVVFREPGQALGGPSSTGWVLAGGALSGALLAGLLAVVQRLLSWRETGAAFLSGLNAAALAIGILFLAWTLGDVCRDLGTAEYLSAGIDRGLSAAALPVALFLLGALISFATGSSFSTMGILLPIAVPLVHTTAATAGLAPMPLTVITIAAVLDGAIFGDHCSPISDTTVLASASSGSDHLDHVRTQLPYALTTMGIALLVGYAPVLMGVPVWITLPAGVLGCALALRLVGRRV